MGRRIEAALLNEKIFLWGFRTSALIHLLATIPILFVFIEWFRSSLDQRYLYIASNKWLYLVSWGSTIILFLSLFFIFTTLLFYLNHTYRVILQWAWFLCVIAVTAGIICYLIQVTLVPALLDWMTQMQVVPVMLNYAVELDRLMMQLGTVFIPTCLAIGGLIYTGVMFHSRQFSMTLCCWSFTVWTALLLVVCLSAYLGELILIYIGLIIFLFIPWLWTVAHLQRSAG